MRAAAQQTCPVCRGRNFKTNHLVASIVVSECKKCHLLLSRIVPQEKPTSEFQRINEAAYEKGIGAVRRQQARRIIASVAEHAKPAGKWVDVGCSFGYLLKEAQESNFKVFGIEPDSKAYEHASGLLGERHVYHGLMQEFALENDSCDVISILDVLEHIPSVEVSDFMAMLRRKLQDGGLLAIKVPSTEGLYFKLGHAFARWKFIEGAIKRLWQSEYEFPHTLYFDRYNLSMLLRLHGFDLVHTSYLQEVPNNTIMDRLLMDDTIPPLTARLMAPLLLAVNILEGLRGKSDALLMVARKAATQEI